MFADDERGKTVRAGFLAGCRRAASGEPSDLAGPLLFLRRKASDFYTGHIPLRRRRLHGGMSMAKGPHRSHWRGA
jgi:hypothetical protein